MPEARCSLDRLDSSRGYWMGAAGLFTLGLVLGFPLLGGLLAVGLAGVALSAFFLLSLHSRLRRSGAALGVWPAPMLLAVLANLILLWLMRGPSLASRVLDHPDAPTVALAALTLAVAGFLAGLLVGFGGAPGSCLAAAGGQVLAQGAGVAVILWRFDPDSASRLILLLGQSSLGATLAATLGAALARRSCRTGEIGRATLLLLVGMTLVLIDTLRPDVPPPPPTSAPLPALDRGYYSSSLLANRNTVAFPTWAVALYRPSQHRICILFFTSHFDPTRLQEARSLADRLGDPVAANLTLALDPAAPRPADMESVRGARLFVDTGGGVEVMERPGPLPGTLRADLHEGGGWR